MRRAGVLLACACALVTSGCDNSDPTIHIPSTQAAETAPVTFSVEYAGTFPAAYADRANKRSIYVITDKATGLKYMAVEGCGTAQLVTVRNGKTSHVEEQ